MPDDKKDEAKKLEAEAARRKRLEGAFKPHVVDPDTAIDSDEPEVDVTESDQKNSDEP